MTDLRLDSDRIRIELSDLEAALMELVWSEQWSQFRALDIHAALERRRESWATAPLPFSQVVTATHRLCKKGILARRRGWRSFIYRPIVTRKAFFRTLSRPMIGSLPSLGPSEWMVSAAVRDEAPSGPWSGRGPGSR